MMASNDDARDRPSDHRETRGAPLSRTASYGSADERLTRYDLVLAVIPTAFLIAMVASELLSVAPRTLLGVAGLVGALAVADTLFVNPPSSGSRPR